MRNDRDGVNNGLSYKGRPLSNWWEFIGDYDQVYQMPLLFGVLGLIGVVGGLVIRWNVKPAADPETAKPGVIA